MSAATVRAHLGIGVGAERSLPIIGQGVETEDAFTCGRRIGDEPLLKKTAQVTDRNHSCRHSIPIQVQLRIDPQSPLAFSRNGEVAQTAPRIVLIFVRKEIEQLAFNQRASQDTPQARGSMVLTRVAASVQRPPIPSFCE